MLSSGISRQDLCPLSVDRPCPGKTCIRLASKAAGVPRQNPTLTPRLLARQASRHQRLLPSPAYAEGASGQLQFVVGLAHAICTVCRMITAYLTAPCAAGFVPYPYNEQMYHRIQTAMVAGSGNGEGTIVLMREDALTGQHQAGTIYYPSCPVGLGGWAIRPCHLGCLGCSLAPGAATAAEARVCQLRA